MLCYKQKVAGSSPASPTKNQLWVDWWDGGHQRTVNPPP